MFEMSLIELPGCKHCLVCVYRSPDGQSDKFLNKLELVIQKLLIKDKILILLMMGIQISFMKTATKRT
jgi:hypothetical protein